MFNHEKIADNARESFKGYGRVNLAYGLTHKKARLAIAEALDENGNEGEFRYKIAAFDPQSGLVLSEMTAKPSKKGVALEFPLKRARVSEGHQGRGIFTTMVAHSMKVAHEKGMSVANRPVLNAGMRKALLPFGWRVTARRKIKNLQVAFMGALNENMDSEFIRKMMLNIEGIEQPRAINLTDE